MSDFLLAIVAIDKFKQAEPLESTRTAQRFQNLLVPYGAEIVQVKPNVTANGLLKFLHQWARDERRPTNSILYWVGHGSREGPHAWLLASNSKSPLSEAVAVNATAVADMVRMRWVERTAGANAWTVLILDCCRGGDAATAIVHSLTAELGKRMTLAVVEAGGSHATEVGRFVDALAKALDRYKEEDEDIPLRSLLDDVTDELGVVPTIRWLPRNATIANPKATIARWGETVAALEPDVRDHFLPKAQGGETQGLTWNFVGREAESEQLAHWLATADSGLMVVTGEPGAGKSALLGRFVLLADRTVCQSLNEARLLEGSAAESRPDIDVFDQVLLLTGKTLGEAKADLEGEAGGRPRTILVDALDEAQAPLQIAHDVLRPLARQPGVRVVVGTRGSLAEGPDLIPSPRNELLDALGVSRDESVVLRRNPDSMARFARAQLTAAGMDPQLTRHVVERVRDIDQPFLFVRLALHELLRRGESADIATADRVLSGSHGDILGMTIQRLTGQDGTVADLLRALAYAHGRGLPRHDGVWAAVARALSPGRQFGADDIDRALDVASPYVARDGEHGQSVYRLAHRTFAERFHAADNDLAASHRAIAEELVRLGSVDWMTANPYVLAHLPRHAASSPDVLDRIVADPGWLDAANRFFGTAVLLQLLEGIDYVQRTPAFTRIRGALRQARQALAGDPDQLAAQLQYRLRGEDVSAVATLVSRLDEIAPATWLRIIEGNGSWSGHHISPMTFNSKIRALASGRIGGQAVLLVGLGDRVQWWDPVRGDLADVADNDGDRVTSLALGTIDGRDVFVLGALCEGTVTVRPVGGGEPIAKVSDVRAEHVDLALLDGQVVIVTAQDGVVKPFTLKGEPLRPLDAGGEILALGHEGTSVLALVDHAGRVRVRQWSEPGQHHDRGIEGAKRGVTASLVEIDGAAVAVLAGRDWIDAWHVDTGKHVGHVTPDPGFPVRTATAIQVETDIALAAGNDTDFEGGYIIVRTPEPQTTTRSGDPRLVTATAVGTTALQSLLLEPLRILDIRSGHERSVTIEELDVATVFGAAVPHTRKELAFVADHLGPSVDRWIFGSLDGERVVAVAGRGGFCQVLSVTTGQVVAGPFGTPPPGWSRALRPGGVGRAPAIKGGPQPSHEVAFGAYGDDAVIACVHEGAINAYDVRAGHPFGADGLSELPGSEATAVAIGTHPAHGLVLARGARGGATSIWAVPKVTRLCGLYLDHGISRLWFDDVASRLVALSNHQVYVADIVSRQPLSP